MPTSPPIATAECPPTSSDALYRASLRRFLAPIVDFLDDPSVSEILVNGATEIYVERGGCLTRTAASFGSESSLAVAVRNIAQFAGRHVDVDALRLDARLPDGSRVHVVQPPCSRRGTVVAIRKFTRELFDLERLVELGSLTASAAEFLALCVLLRKNILVAGGTGSGKTSLLNALSAAIPAAERIVVLEDSSELQLRQPHVVPLEARAPDARGRGEVTIRDLVRSSLRLRPDRIVIGEVRGGEALDLLQAMTSGHPGSMSTLHADRPDDALRRLETMAMMAAIELPHHAVRAQVASAIEIIVQAARFCDGTRRIVEITRVHSLDLGGGFQLSPVYRFRTGGLDARGRVCGSLASATTLPDMARELEEAGLLSRVRHTQALWQSEIIGSAVPQVSAATREGAS
jgi:pilus assembly protein CpaF